MKDPKELLQPVALLAYLEKACERQIKGFEPQEDFTTVLHVINSEGAIGIYGLVAMEGPELASALYVCEKMAPNTVVSGLVVAAWRTEHKPGTPLLIRPAKDPDRVEIVMIVVAYQDGVISSTAKVKRHKKRGPTLSAWEQSLQPQNTLGAFSKAMLAGLSTAKPPEVSEVPK